MAGAGIGYGSASLYVGDLDHNVIESQLFDLFSQIAQVVSVRVCRDLTRRSSLGYAYVNFTNPLDAATAMETLNFTPLNGKPMRIMFSHRDPSVRKSGHGNVFIKNLDTSIDNKALHETFVTYGNVLSCKVALDENGQSKGYGFVQFQHEEDAKNAIKELNNMLLNDKQVYVGLFVRRQERGRSDVSRKFTNVYVKNLSEETTDKDLMKLFSPFGSITSAVVMKDKEGKSRCFGFVNFQSSDAAALAVEKLNGTTFAEEKVLHVGRAQSKAEREAELRAKFEQEKRSRYEKLQGCNLYLKNLDDNITEEKLKELFSEYGTVTSCKVLVDSQCIIKGSGFVAFSSPDEASKALDEMNGKMVGRKPLYVALAQRKEDRKARLQAHFAQVQTSAPPSPMVSGFSRYHPAAVRVGGQQLYYGQGNHAMLPHQAASYGFQQQLLPIMRPGVSPNFIMPYSMQRQGQPRHQMSNRRRGNPQQMQQQQLLQRNSNQGYGHNVNARNGIDQFAGSNGILGPMMPIPLSVSENPVTLETQRHGPVPISKLTSALTSASSIDRTVILGEQLYPIVERLEPDHTAKVTGMLLEMDQTEVLHLIESPDALKKKVGEAMEVLLNKSSGATSNGEDQR